MSDISLLSDQYEKLVSTSEKINNSVITFKKTNLLSNVSLKTKYPRLNVSGDEVSTAREILLSFLQNIRNILEENATRSEFIPSAVFLEMKHKLSTNPYLIEDVNNIIKHLERKDVLNENDIEALDNILLVLDSERSILFRKLRTARG